MKTDINQSLLEIEKNLKDLSSARDQVLDVTSSSSELILATTDLTKKINSLYKAVVKDASAYDSAFEKYREEIDEKLQKLVTDSQGTLNAFLDNIHTVEEEFSKETLKLNETMSSKAESVFEQHETNLRLSLEKLEEFSNDLIQLSKEIDSFDFDKALKPILNELESTQENITSVVKTESLNLQQKLISVQDTLFESQKTHLEEILVKIKETSSKIEHTQKNNAYITWGINIFSLVIIVLILIFF